MQKKDVSNTLWSQLNGVSELFSTINKKIDEAPKAAVVEYSEDPEPVPVDLLAKKRTKKEAVKEPVKESVKEAPSKKDNKVKKTTEDSPASKKPVKEDVKEEPTATKKAVKEEPPVTKKPVKEDVKITVEEPVKKTVKKSEPTKKATEEPVKKAVAVEPSSPKEPTKKAAAVEPSSPKEPTKKAAAAVPAPSVPQSSKKTGGGSGKTVEEPSIPEEPQNKVVKVSNEEEEEDAKIPIYERRKKIPKAIRTIVWNKYVGAGLTSARCTCCRSELIGINNWHCGHVIAESKGGDLNINNLRPICAPCNQSMGTRSMNEFTMEYFGWTI
jgi:5-methylcytosine-specific restriction endonuclease McrA